MNINELITKAHGIAKSKGFWDTERNTGELLMLIVSECGEALEAHRKWHRADLAGYDETQDGDGPTKRFKIYIKDTFEDELADIVIRIADAAGGLGIHPDKDARDPLSYGTRPNDGDLYKAWKLPDNVEEFLFDRVVHGVCAFRKRGLHGSLLHMPIASIKIWCDHHGIDLMRHIELKMAYNETRERLHGKAY